MNMTKLSISYTDAADRDALYLSKNEITSDVIHAMLNDLETDAAILEIDYDDNSLSVEFDKQRDAFIGWYNVFEDEFYFLDNGSGGTECVDLLVNVCPEERMMCYAMDDIKAIVSHFCETGQLHPAFTWILDNEI